MKRMTIAAAVVSTLAIGATAASAVPLSGVAGAGDAAAAENLVQRTHGLHSGCALGPGGWHYHPRRGVRVACGVRPRGGWWTWRHEGNRWGWWHRRERRWHD